MNQGCKTFLLCSTDYGLLVLDQGHVRVVLFLKNNYCRTADFRVQEIFANIARFANMKYSRIAILLEGSVFYGESHNISMHANIFCCTILDLKVTIKCDYTEKFPKKVNTLNRKPNKNTTQQMSISM